ncbi:MAG: methyltransferase family protein [Gemmobacter sp.]
MRLLRALFVAALPLVVFSRSVWMDRHWAFELLEVAGVLLVIAAVLGRFWAILYVGGRKTRTVMQDGPYSVVRHPLYVSSTIGIVGFGLMLGSLVLTALVGGLTFLILRAQAIREEHHLRAIHGKAWDDYAARVPRLVPDPRLFRTDPDVTFRVSELRRNFGDALGFLCLIPFAELMEVLKEYAMVPTFPIF